ncbi:MAG: hypothetical protein ACI37O_01705 [Candidatus Avelusimicrobium sp.]|uniref:hypothetical protein n=1 Tax=Candidatus Avelusimicrobium sp. TaxID=3048833 RepID=UPI003F077F0D
MTQETKIENVPYNGTFETALDALKNNKSVQESLRGFKVVTADISGGELTRTLSITCVKDLRVSDLEEALNALLKSVAATLVKNAEKKQEKTND